VASGEWRILKLVEQLRDADDSYMDSVSRAVVDG
jgi:hypothetical protein